MPTIVLIDDDYATEILRENLSFRGYNATRIASAAAALEQIETIAKADLVILDIIMERPSDTPSVSGDRTTGMEILKALRKTNPTLPILVFSGSSDGDLIQTINSMTHTIFISKWSTPSQKDLVGHIERTLGQQTGTVYPRAFIVHGHDDAEKLALKNYLQNTLKFPESIILHEQPGIGRTIIEKLEDYAFQVELAFVLLTPDDKLSSEGDSNDERRRARQNVIFELGYFLGVLGRASGRVFLLYKGPLDLPSDIFGLIYIDVSHGIAASGEIIPRELAHVLA